MPKFIFQHGACLKDTDRDTSHWAELQTMPLVLHFAQK